MDRRGPAEARAARVEHGSPGLVTSPGSPARQFAVLGLVVIGAIALGLGLVLTYFVERGILDREWASTAAVVRTASLGTLRPGDFAAEPGGDREAAADRFEEVVRQVRLLPEIRRIVAYDSRGEPAWRDTERGPAPHAMHEWLRRALAGETSVRLDRESAGRRVEVYVPITFPGEGRVSGVIETYVDPARALATAARARWVLWSLAVLSGVLLYGTLWSIVWRASRTLSVQHRTLAGHADALARANEELRAAQAELVRAERFAAIGEITATVAHGLGNPLAAIRAGAQVALLDATGSVRDRLAQILSDADRATGRMRALLDLGRPSRARQLPAALDSAVEHALDQVRARAAAQGVRVELDVPGDLPKVRLDPASFEEALLCLVGNALDAMPSGGTLRVAARRAVEAAGSRAELTVADSGPGIPEGARARVFEPFFTTKPNGTGLGLPVARKLLDGGGACLDLSSPAAGGPGGTCVRILLPIEAP